MTPLPLDVLAASVGSAVHPRVPLEFAECYGAESELFFSCSQESERAAKAVCGRCEVRWECLLYALETRQPSGVWGGLNTTERRLLRRRIAAVGQTA